jgi:hypothetical protein
MKKWWLWSMILLILALILGASMFEFEFYKDSSDAIAVHSNAGIAVQGYLSDYHATGGNVKYIYLMRNHCGATIVERDGTTPVNPSAELTNDGHFRINIEKDFLGKSVLTRVKADGVDEKDLHEDFFTLSVFDDKGVHLLASPDGKIVRLRQQGGNLQVENKPSELRLSSVAPPLLIIVRQPNGDMRAGQGGLTFTAPGEC